MHAFRLNSLVTPIHNHRLRMLPGEDADLLERFFQRVPVVRIARHRAHPHNESFLERGRHRYLHAELIGRSCLAFRDALNLRRVERVELVLVLGLLRQDPLRPIQALSCPNGAGKSTIFRMITGVEKPAA